MALNCKILQKSVNLITCLLAFNFLLFTTLTPIHFMAQGRQFGKHIGDTMQRMRSEENVVRMRSLIGSRPPRCAERCKSCVQCVAIQVPIVAKKIAERSSSHFYKTAYSRGDDISNYKPMSWKCKCGDFIFNPW